MVDQEAPMLSSGEAPLDLAERLRQRLASGQVDPSWLEEAEAHFQQRKQDVSKEPFQASIRLGGVRAPKAKPP